MRCDEIWMSTRQLAALVALAASTNSRPGDVMEIGVWQGRSAIYLANAVWPTTFHAVDHWLGSSDMPEPIKARDNFGIFRRNVIEKTRGNIHIHKTSWQELARIWKTPLRFLHLDAEHTQEEVAGQIAAFRPFISCGVIAGDDYNWSGVRRGILEHWPEDSVHTLEDKLWWVNVGDDT